MPKRSRCAACGTPVGRSRAIEVDLWDAEGVAVVVCSERCREAYAAGPVTRRATNAGGAAGRPAPRSRVQLETVAVILVAAAVELSLGVVALAWLDPLATVVPWPVHVAVAAILAVLGVALLRGRHAAGKAALAVAVISSLSHAVIAFVSLAPQALVAPVSLLLALVLLAGRPGIARQAAALGVAAVLPVFIAGAVVVRARGRAEATRRIDLIALPGRTISSGPGGARVTLAEGWRALRRDNGLIDWPHSEIEAVHVESGAAAFVVINPDCDRESLPELSQRSLDALARAGGEPRLAGTEQVGAGALELRVLTRRGRSELMSFDLFDELRGSGGSSPPPARPGCVWLHCLAPDRERRRVRADCRAMLGSIERL